MENIDEFMRERNFDMISKTLTDSQFLCEKLMSYDDMPSSEAFDDSIIEASAKLSKRLFVANLMLECIHGD